MTNILHQLERAEDDANLAFLRSEVARLRLTDAEREAAMTLISCGEQSEDVGDQHAADTLRGLLERTNHDAVPAAIAPVDRLVRLGATDRESVGTDKAEPLTRDCGTGNTDARLAALEELSALDQKLELEYGIVGNPMIKAQPCKAAKTDTTQPRNGTLAERSEPRECTEPVAWALIATEGAIAGDVLAVTTTRELAFRKFVDSHQPCRIVPLIVAPAEDRIAGRERRA